MGHLHRALGVEGQPRPGPPPVEWELGGDTGESGALVPVQCSVRHGYAVYVEPNVWVRHRA